MAFEVNDSAVPLRGADLLGSDDDMDGSFDLQPLAAPTDQQQQDDIDDNNHNDNNNNNNNDNNDVDDEDEDEDDDELEGATLQFEPAIFKTPQPVQKQVADKVATLRDSVDMEEDTFMLPTLEL